MVKLIMGLKGSGKTKQLVTDINEAVKNETGSMVCIEKGTKLRYDIDIRVRLIDYQEYSMGTLTFLKASSAACMRAISTSATSSSTASTSSSRMRASPRSRTSSCGAISSAPRTTCPSPSSSPRTPRRPPRP